MFMFSACSWHISVNLCELFVTRSTLDMSGKAPTCQLLGNNCGVSFCNNTWFRLVSGAKVMLNVLLICTPPPSHDNRWMWILRITQRAAAEACLHATKTYSGDGGGNILRKSTWIQAQLKALQFECLLISFINETWEITKTTNCYWNSWQLIFCHSSNWISDQSCQLCNNRLKIELQDRRGKWCWNTKIFYICASLSFI